MRIHFSFRWHRDNCGYVSFKSHSSSPNNLCANIALYSAYFFCSILLLFSFFYTNKIRFIALNGNLCLCKRFSCVWNGIHALVAIDCVCVCTMYVDNIAVSFASFPLRIPKSSDIIIINVYLFFHVAQLYAYRQLSNAAQRLCLYGNPTVLGIMYVEEKRRIHVQGKRARYIFFSLSLSRFVTLSPAFANICVCLFWILTHIWNGSSAKKKPF